MSILSKPFFHNEAAAVDFVEAMVWGEDGKHCPHCGSTDRLNKIKANPEKRVGHGLHKCGECHKQFTVKVGTIFEGSNLPLHKWLQAIYLMSASKKGVSAHQLHRTLEITYKTAWYLEHRIREAMRSGDLAAMGSDGGVVEVDETFIGHDQTVKPKGEKKGRGFAHKHEALSLVERGTGKARTMLVNDIKAATLVPILEAYISAEATIYTDEAGQYRRLSDKFAEDEFVRYGRGECARGRVAPNTVEGYCSIFKRGIKGIYQHAAKRHLHRYLAEFDFRYNTRELTDLERMKVAVRGSVGKRLRYSSV